MGQPPKRIRYRNATYVLAKYGIPELSDKPYYTHEEIRSRGAVEVGIVTDLTDGEPHPGWADLGGWKYVEMEGKYIRIDQAPDKWAWDWDGMTQDDIIDFMWNKKFKDRAL